MSERYAQKRIRELRHQLKVEAANLEVREAHDKIAAMALLCEAAMLPPTVRIAVERYHDAKRELALCEAGVTTIAAEHKAVTEGGEGE